MNTKTTKEVAEMLGVSRYQIDQWISREQFLAAIFGTRGMARDWTLDETVRLAVFIELVRAGLHPKRAGSATQIGMHATSDEPAFFVAWQGASGMEDAASNYAEALDLAAGYGDAWHPEFLGASEIGSFLSRPAVLRSIILPLDGIAGRLKALWG